MNNPTVSFEVMQERLWGDIRLHRNQQLEKADIEIRKAEDSGSDAAQWRTYRQQLRDLPNQTDNPHEVVWPKAPA